MLLRRTHSASAALALLLLSLGAAAAQELRTWSDASGKFQIKAKLLADKAGKVTLEREDGTKIEIELQKLSEADQKYLAELRKQQDDNPFKVVPSAPKVAKGDLSTARLVQTTLPAEWRHTVKPPMLTPPEKVANAPIPAAARANIFERSSALLVAANGRRAVLSYRAGVPGKHAETRLLYCDLEQGKVLYEHKENADLQPLALDPDGELLLLRPPQHFSNKDDRVELWTLGAKEVSKRASWSLYESAHFNERVVSWAAFLDSKRLATLSGGGKLVVWSLDKMQAQLSAQVQSGCTPALSADRKLLAYSTQDGLGVLDLDAGEVVAGGKYAHLGPLNLSFSPDSKWLSTILFDKLTVFDVATGEVHREFPLTGMFNFAVHCWLDGDHLLVGNQHVLARASQVRVWDYVGCEQAQPTSGPTWVLVAGSRGQPDALVPLALPQPAARDALARALADPEFFVYKAGTAVRLDLSALTDAKQREKIQAVLEAKVKANGGQVDATANVDVVVTVEQGPERTINQNSFEGGKVVMKQHKIRETLTKLKFVAKGKTVWEQGAGNMGQFAPLKPGEKFEDYLRSREGPNYVFLENVLLPRVIARTGASGALGKSAVTTAGLQ